MTAPWFDVRTSVRGWLLVLAVLAAVVVLFVTSGRGGRIVANGPVVRHESGWGLGGASGMDAIVGGVLAYDRGCVLLGGSPVVWPDGTSWDEDAGRVRLDDGTALEAGAMVRGAGGYVDEPRQGGDWSGVADCLSPSQEIVVFNADSTLDVDGES